MILRRRLSRKKLPSRVGFFKTVEQKRLKAKIGKKRRDSGNTDSAETKEFSLSKTLGEDDAFSSNKLERERSRELSKNIDSSTIRKPRLAFSKSSQLKRNLILPRSMKAKKVSILEENIRLMANSLAKELENLNQEILDSFLVDLRDFEINLSLAKEDPENFYNSSIGKYLLTIRDLLIKIERALGLTVDVKQLKEVVDLMVKQSSLILRDHVAFADKVLGGNSCGQRTSTTRRW